MLSIRKNAHAILMCLNSNLDWGYDAIISSKTQFKGKHVAFISERGPDSFNIVHRNQECGKHGI